MSKVNIAVFVSGGGTNMQAVIDKIETNEINGAIKVVISSNDRAFAIERAKKYNIKSEVVAKKDYPDESKRTEKILSILKDNEIDLIVLGGYMSILGEALINQYRNKIINVHPALIPSFCGQGYYGRRVHEAVVEYGVKLSGATVHFVDEGTDTGPIIMQESVKITHEDTADTVSEKVLKIEHRLLPEAVKLYCNNQIAVEGRIVKIEE